MIDWGSLKKEQAHEYVVASAKIALEAARCQCQSSQIQSAEF